MMLETDKAVGSRSDFSARPI